MTSPPDEINSAPLKTILFFPSFIFFFNCIGFAEVTVA
ncbi:hypothetical protein BJAB0715_01277 [Acinetobacter baumannii BJAB0715]|nr:hypothetical protein BJAB0715_01277 [Acinetobacter baumannii BJAB0715]